MTALLSAEPKKTQRAIDLAWRATPDTFGRRLSSGTWTAPKHVRLLCWVLYLSSIGYSKRTAVSMPPGHGKSEATDVWFPAWDLEVRPDDRIILASYGQELAEEWGKKVRMVLTDAQDQVSVRLRQDSQASNRWRTEAGGGMWAVGAGGSITGRRARLFVIDDPFKGFDDSHSPRQRQGVWDWYRSVARTRLLPGASIVIVQTRWHEEDLIGKVTEQGNWTHVRMPALAEEDETIETVLGPEFVARCRRDGIWLPEWNRKQGEPLWPWMVEPCEAVPDGVPWFSKEELEETRQEVGEYIWSSLYQQHPVALDGELFKRHSWNRVDEAPAGLQLVRRWDMAATEGGGDWTAGCLMGRSKDGRTYVLDVRRARFGPSGVEKFIRQTADEDREKYGSKLLIKIEQEGGSAGKNVAQHYVANVLAGFNVVFEGSSGDKTVRALPLAAQQEAGNVFLVRRMTAEGPVTPTWFDDFIEEAAAFPNGRNDDMVDVASLAFTDLTAMPRSRARVSSVAGKRIVG